MWPKHKFAVNNNILNPSFHFSFQNTADMEISGMFPMEDYMRSDLMDTTPGVL